MNNLKRNIPGTDRILEHSEIQKILENYRSDIKNKIDDDVVNGNTKDFRKLSV